jgi:hypothetical protein
MNIALPPEGLDFTGLIRVTTGTDNKDLSEADNRDLDEMKGAVMPCFSHDVSLKQNERALGSTKSRLPMTRVTSRDEPRRDN